jgi:tripeptidyl-peptidase I
MGWHVGRLILLCIAALSSIAVESKYDDRSHTYLSGRLSDTEQLQHTHVFKESMPLFSSRTDVVKKQRPHDDYVHEVMFAVQMKNMDELTRILHDVSDPDSPNYGQHLKREEMHDLISNPEACSEVTLYLHASGATSVAESLGCQYITAEAPIGVWEKMFNADFFHFQQTHLNGETHEVVRAEHYSVPKEIHHHIEAVMNTIEMPMLSRTRLKSFPITEVAQESDGDRKLAGVIKDRYITPAKLRNYYNMGDSHGSSLSTQAVYANSFYYYSPSDVAWFQANVSRQPLQAAISIGNHNTTNSTKYDCSEGNLDLQYIMALSPGSPTTYWYFDASLGRWLKEVASTKKIPWVLSISYGSYEDTTSKNEFSTFTTMAIQLGVMGITILGASGDFGAGFEKQKDGACRYSPEFPASSPYIVSVGATMVSEDLYRVCVCVCVCVCGNCGDAVYFVCVVVCSVVLYCAVFISLTLLQPLLLLVLLLLSFLLLSLSITTIIRTS